MVLVNVSVRPEPTITTEVGAVEYPCVMAVPLTTKVAVPKWTVPVNVSVPMPSVPPVVRLLAVLIAPVAVICLAVVINPPAAMFVPALIVLVEVM